MKRDPDRAEVAMRNVVAQPTNPRASAYQQRLAAKRRDVPRGGDVPMPKMPRFDQDPPQRQAASQVSVPLMGGLNHADTLTDAAKKDPRYIQGHGSELAVNQPHLAFQYGVMRGDRYIPPSDLRPPQPEQGGGIVGPRRPLKPETIEGIQALQKMEQKKKEAEKAAEVEVTEAEAASTARLAGEPEASPEDEEKVKKAISGMDDLDFYNFTQAMMRDLINNEQQRKLIESRLEPIDITDLLVMDSYAQKVPIIPGKFEPVFETIGGKNDLALKKLIAEEARELNVNERYLLDKFAMMQLAAGVKAIGSVQMPEYRDSDGVLVPEMFWKRFNKITSLPTPVLASLGANYFWFDVRGRGACTAKELKNG
jgi:hypothetical protein